jgi:hypothetical protein
MGFPGLSVARNEGGHGAVDLAGECQRGVDAGEPASAEAPERRQGAVAPAADVGIGGKRLLDGMACDCRQSQRADLAVGIGADGLLQHARGASDALVDGGIEMEERECGRQLGARGGLPVVLVVVAPHRVARDRWLGFMAAVSKVEARPCRARTRRA